MLIMERVTQLVDRCRREVEEGLLPGNQIALGYEGEIVVMEAFGDMAEDSRSCFFSATKAFVAAAMWHLIADGSVAVSNRVTDYVPEFGAQDKADITVEQVMLHTSGFPHAPLGPGQWETKEGRLAAFARWRCNWEPGTRYEYHPTSAHWVLAEIIDRVTGQDYRDVVEARVCAPLGIGRILGLDATQTRGIVDLELVGEHATPDELLEAFGVSKLPVTEVTDTLLLNFNEPSARAVGVPGGGGYGSAADLATLYQGLLHNPGDNWDPATLADATGTVRNSLPDPMGVPANRSLGLILAGDDGKSNIRGLGRTVSPQAFGHNGAKGQLAWGDPATGLSIGYVTNGLDLHEVREPRRGTAIASLAGLCTTPL